MQTQGPLRVAGTSKPKSVAGAIANLLRKHGEAELQAIGARAVNQALKAVVIARGYVAPNGINAVCVPAFEDLSMPGGKEKTAINIKVIALK